MIYSNYIHYAIAVYVYKRIRSVHKQSAMNNNIELVLV